MNCINDKVIIVIRSVGERTEQLCRELILAQGIAPENVVVVHESPFSAAMRKSFQIGIGRGLPWTFCVDADILLRPGSISRMVELADEQAETVCEVQGFVLDKFFGGPREAGNHLYRTSLLPLVLASIPAEGVDIRPEYHSLKAMKAQGYPWASVQYLVGLHDFEQYFRDIFRKCFVHAHKHLQWAELFLSLWRERSSSDADYWTALQGFAAGVAHTGDVLIDIRQEIYEAGFNALETQEKSPLSPGSFSLDDVEEVIGSWNEPDAYQLLSPMELDLENPEANKPLSIPERISHRMSKVGLIKVTPYTIGWLLHHIGRKLQTWATQ